jgi:hypothetical protein
VNVADVLTGHEFTRPLKNLPHPWVLKTATNFIGKVSPGARIEAHTDQPFVEAILGGSSQIIRGDMPGQEPSITNRNLEEDCSVLGGEFANKKNVTASKRKKLLSNSKTNQSYSFDTDTVYTFEFYQNLFDVSVSSVDAFCCYFNYFKSLLCQLYFHTCNTGNHLLARSRLRQIRMQPYT